VSDIYETDILLWSERQADLLRRLAAGERVNDQVDWENVVEEVESVGREQLHAVESLLLQALVHLLKAQAWPQSQSVPHWQSEARLFRAQAANRFVPSMRQRLSLDMLYRQALAAVPDSMDGVTPGLLPSTCPLTLEQLLAPEPPAEPT